MYHKAYGIIETLAPLHVGASAGEETGNLNLIFRDQFTQTGIIPGSSIRGRFRADMRLKRMAWLEAEAKELNIQAPQNIDENYWYGHESVQGQEDGGTTEALIKFEYASLVWIPVFCPGQPIVWVSCHRLLKRYQQITGGPKDDQGKFLPVPKPTGDPKRHPVKLKQNHNRLFFNLGFLDNLTDTPELEKWVPQDNGIQPDNLVVVEDADISLIHDMALYRQTRTKLEDNVKKVEHFFGFEALPEDSILIFPVAIKKNLPDSAKTALEKLKQSEEWQPFGTDASEKDLLARSLYFGGLESIGCGRCRISLSGKYFSNLKVGA